MRVAMCVFSVNIFVSNVQISLQRMWTHQIIQHPHQRFKLQLPNFPLMLSTHVHIGRRGHIENAGFVFLLVQHNQVVHATSARDGVHLNPHSEDRDTRFVALDDPRKIRTRNKFLINYQYTRKMPKPKWDTPQSKAPTSPRNIQYRAFNQHGWGICLLKKNKLGFAGWINVFFCLTRESQ